MSNLRNQTSDVLNIKEENNILSGKIESIQVEAESLLKENERLSDELDRKQTLYRELKKMRGRGEEMDLLQQMEKVRDLVLYGAISSHVFFISLSGLSI